MQKTLFITFGLFPAILSAQHSGTDYNISDLKQNPAKTEHLLTFALNTEQWEPAAQLLAIYQSFPHSDPKLINYAQFRLAQSLFEQYQNSEALAAFQAVQNQQNLTNEEKAVISQYITALDERESWQFSASVNYVQNKNVNKTSADRNIENTGFVKNEDMLPQAAHGVGYFAEITKRWHLGGANNLYFANEISGTNYWDNHNYDEITNRTYLGYLYQNNKFQWALKPFYERQWVGNHRYNWANGVRMEYRQPFAKKWQFSTAWEFSQPRYFSQTEKNGTIKLLSATLLRQINEKGYVYIGADFIREQTRVKQYSNDTKSLRLGWKQIWEYDIATQLNGSLAVRQYKDMATLGGILPLDNIRRDKIYSLNFTLWKTDWHWHGFTPKIQAKWKRQSSNIPTMFSYSEKYMQMLVEKEF